MDRDAFRRKQAALTEAFEQLLSTLSFSTSIEERSVVEHYIEHREFGLALDRLCDTVFPGKPLTEDDRVAVGDVARQMGGPSAYQLAIVPWLDDQAGRSDQRSCQHQ
jgi:hypothetical protein